MNGTDSPEGRSPAMDRLVVQLAALGAETPTERSVKRVLPWVLSIVLHLTIALIAVFITWTVANRPEEDEGILIVADFNALTYEPVTMTSEPQPLEERRVERSDFASPLSSELPNELNFAPKDGASFLNTIGPAVDAGAFAVFAPASRGDSVSFAGASATNARKIVYAIDATGDMIAHFQIVIDELSRSMANLTPQQSYAVIFFQGDQAIETPPGRLVPATPAERDRALKWIRASIVPRGETNPLSAIEKAIRLKPDVVFILSHGITGYGKFEVDQRELLARLDKLNPISPATGRRGTQINCIQFLKADPLDTLKLIAEQHGGPHGYKFLSREELGLGGS